MTTVAPREGVVYGLSCTCHPEDGIRYVGQTVNAKTRLVQHFANANYRRTKNYPVCRWIKKHGRDNIVMDILKTAPRGPALDAAEVAYIFQHKTFRSEHGLNATVGGSGTPMHSAKRGGSHHSSKLTDEQAREVYELVLMGEFTQKEIAETYGVSKQTVTDIIQGKTYRNLSLPALTDRRSNMPHMVGENNRNAKLTDEQVLQIHARHEAGERADTLSIAYGVSVKSVNLIARGGTHSHLNLKNISRGRRPPRKAGESNQGAKMTEAEAREAYRRVVAGEKCADVASDYGVRSAAISKIVTGASWRDLGLTPRVFEKIRNPSNGRMQSRLAELGTVLT